MRTFVTGGTGFIGKQVVSDLRARSEDVVALVRSPAKASDLVELGCELAEGDLSDTSALTAAMKGCDSVFHIAAVYKVGITAPECAAMWEANVAGTERVFDAAAEAGVDRIVYVSTIGYFGNTKGQIVDETYRRPTDGFLSCYDETKFRAHEIALDRIRAGAPIVIAQPGGVYGPGDHSEVAGFIAQAAAGKLKMMMFPELGFNALHVEDAATGIVLVHDKGRIGESYCLGGRIATLGQVVELVAEITGHKPPRFTMPAPLIRMSIPFGPLVTRMMGLPPNLRELIRVSDGVTYWASDAKAREELGYSPRDLDEGLRQTLGA